jgi:threonine/homoserine efflux transporter RhtA
MAEGHGLALVGLAAHLVDVPIGVQQAEVHHAHVGADAFHLLGVPQREGVVVAVGEEDGVRCAAVQVIGCQVAGGVAAAAVVVIPFGAHHHHRHGQAQQRWPVRRGRCRCACLAQQVHQAEGRAGKTDEKKQ